MKFRNVIDHLIVKMNRNFIGYYSEFSEIAFGYAVYSTLEGKEVKVTEVSCGEPLSRNTDLVLIGPVVKCVNTFRHCSQISEWKTNIQKPRKKWVFLVERLKIIT